MKKQFTLIELLVDTVTWPEYSFCQLLYWTIKNFSIVSRAFFRPENAILCKKAQKIIAFSGNMAILALVIPGETKK